VAVLLRVAHDEGGRTRAERKAGCPRGQGTPWRLLASCRAPTIEVLTRRRRRCATQTKKKCMPTKLQPAVLGQMGKANTMVTEHRWRRCILIVRSATHVQEFWQRRFRFFHFVVSFCV
jgi:hypothetical protein